MVSPRTGLHCPALLMAALALWSAQRAGAQQASTAGDTLVLTHVDDCVPVDRAQLDKLLSIELGTSGASEASTVPAEDVPTRVWVRCGPSGIELFLEDGVTRKTMMRVLPAEAFQEGSQTRLLALSIAELVVASWVELRLIPKPAVEPVGPPLSPRRRQQAERVLEARAPEPVPDFTGLSLGGLIQGFSEQEGVLLGAALRLTHAPWSWLALSVEADTSFMTVDVEQGEVAVNVSSVGVALLLRQASGALALLTGPGARGGLAHARGEAKPGSGIRGDSFYAPLGGAFWLGRFALALSQRIELALDLELGLTTLSATGRSHDQAVLALDGVWFSAGLGMGVVL